MNAILVAELVAAGLTIVLGAWLAIKWRRFMVAPVFMWLEVCSAVMYIVLATVDPRGRSCHVFTHVFITVSFMAMAMGLFSCAICIDDGGGLKRFLTQATLLPGAALASGVACGLLSQITHNSGGYGYGACLTDGRVWVITTSFGGVFVVLFFVFIMHEYARVPHRRGMTWHSMFTGIGMEDAVTMTCRIRPPHAFSTCGLRPGLLAFMASFLSWVALAAWLTFTTPAKEAAIAGIAVCLSVRMLTGCWACVLAVRMAQSRSFDLSVGAAAWLSCQTEATKPDAAQEPGLVDLPFQLHHQQSQGLLLPTLPLWASWTGYPPSHFRHLAPDLGADLRRQFMTDTDGVQFAETSYTLGPNSVFCRGAPVLPLSVSSVEGAVPRGLNHAVLIWRLRSAQQRALVEALPVYLGHVANNTGSTLCSIVDVVEVTGTRSAAFTATEAFVVQIVRGPRATMLSPKATPFSYWLPVTWTSDALAGVSADCGFLDSLDTSLYSVFMAGSPNDEQKWKRIAQALCNTGVVEAVTTRPVVAPGVPAATLERFMGPDSCSVGDIEAVVLGAQPVAPGANQV